MGITDLEFGSPMFSIQVEYQGHGYEFHVSVAEYLVSKPIDCSKEYLYVRHAGYEWDACIDKKMKSELGHIRTSGSMSARVDCFDIDEIECKIEELKNIIKLEVEDRIKELTKALEDTQEISWKHASVGAGEHLKRYNPKEKKGDA